MNFIDATIAAFSPKAAYDRAAYRLALQKVRAYDAAMVGRRTDGWRATGASANAEIAGAAALVRNRARDLVRNNPHGRAAIRKLSAKIVGTGIQPRFLGVSDQQKQKIQSDWDAFTDNCDPTGKMDFYGLQKLAVSTIIESGEVLNHYLPQKSSSKLRIPLQMQLLEPDFIDSSRNESEKNDVIVSQGLEIDKQGILKAFYLHGNHPGEMWGGFGSPESKRVSVDDVDQAFEVLRPGQVRGISWFAPVALKMRDMATYDEAELMRKNIAACFSVFVHRAPGSNRSTLVENPTTKQGGRPIEEVSPGLISYLDGFDQVTFADPKPSEGFSDYMTFQLQAISAGIGLTYAAMTGDLSSANYSSLRAGMVDFWELLDDWQYNMVIPQICRPAWKRFAAVRTALGRPLPTGLKVLWSVPKRTWVDPKKDADAEMELIRNGLKSLRQSISERGDDPEQVLADIAETNKQIDRLGLVLDSDPRKGKAGQAATTSITDLSNA
jgi:lambda family phage portal protein